MATCSVLPGRWGNLWTPGFPKARLSLRTNCSHQEKLFASLPASAAKGKVPCVTQVSTLGRLLTCMNHHYNDDGWTKQQLRGGIQHGAEHWEANGLGGGCLTENCGSVTDLVTSEKSPSMTSVSSPVTWVQQYPPWPSWRLLLGPCEMLPNLSHVIKKDNF